MCRYRRLAACSTAATHMTLPVHTPVRQSIHQERTDSPANWCVHMQSHDSCSAVSTPHAARSAQCILLRNSESPLAPDTPPPPPPCPFNPPPKHILVAAQSAHLMISMHTCAQLSKPSHASHTYSPPHTPHTHLQMSTSTRRWQTHTLPSSSTT